MFSKISINSFRCFTNQDIVLGNYLTILSGRNSTGKSTILGMLGNAAELKKKDGIPYLSKQFRAEFSELLIGSEKHDPTGSNKYEIQVCNGQDTDYRKFRITWQRVRPTKVITPDTMSSSTNNSGQKRFHIVPYRKDDTIQTSAKFNIPVLYLGLSRLFPVGETNHEKLSPDKQVLKSIEHQEWFVEQYRKILSLHDDINSIVSIALGETDKKRAVGVNTDKYDIFANSAGQDNIGQILLALLSFRRIREDHGDTWSGGLLLVDELDATLHPAAQNKLIDLMISESRELGLQIVMTTHSLSLLKYICTKIGHNRNEINNNIELYYFTTANKILQLRRNIDFSAIENDLLLQSVVQTKRQIKVYSEDAEARWFLARLLSKYLSYVELVDVSLGCDQLLSLYKADMGYFGSTIIVFDGDVEDKKLDQIPPMVKERHGNIIKLPSKNRPEQIIYEYLLNLPPEHPYWSEVHQNGFSWDYFMDRGPNHYSQYDKERERYKRWFQDHYAFFDTPNLFDYWASDNPELLSDFQRDFKTAYNKIARRIYLPQIAD